MLVPALIAAIRGIFVTTCDWTFGLVAYAAMPLATAALAGAFGHAFGVLAGPRRYGPAIAITAIPYVALLAAALLRFYFAPPVFSYSPIAGYFPGNLYDENVQLTAPLAWARLEQLAWAIALVAALASLLDARAFRPRLARPRLPAAALGVVALAGALALHYESGELGYRIDADDIEAELGGRLETQHFIIHYAHTTEIDADIALIAEDHEFRYAQVVAQIGAAPRRQAHVVLLRRSRSEGAVDGRARRRDGQAVARRDLPRPPRVPPRLAAPRDRARGRERVRRSAVRRVRAPRARRDPRSSTPGIIEGLAVALDWPGGYDRLTPHEAVRAMQALGVEPSLGELLSLRFFAVSSARGYTTAGSFLRFLLDTYGAPKLRALYGNGGDFAAAYGMPLAQLEAEWKAMLATIAVPTDAVEASRERFRGGSVFSRPCPHAVAAAREHAAEVFAHGDRAEALALMRHVCSEAPEEPRYRMELGDYLAGGTPAERAEAATLWQRVIDDTTDDVTSSLRGEAYEHLARAAAERGDLAATATLVQTAVALPIDTNAHRQLEAEVFALAYTGPAGSALRSYFFPTGVRSLDPKQWALQATLAEPELGLAHYLLGLQRANDERLRGRGAHGSRSALDLGLPGPAFVKNAARRLALVGYRGGDAAGVATAPRRPRLLAGGSRRHERRSSTLLGRGLAASAAA